MSVVVVTKERREEGQRYKGEERGVCRLRGSFGGRPYKSLLPIFTSPQLGRSMLRPCKPKGLEIVGHKAATAQESRPSPPQEDREARVTKC